MTPGKWIAAILLSLFIMAIQGWIGVMVVVVCWAAVAGVYHDEIWARFKELFREGMD